MSIKSKSEIKSEILVPYSDFMKVEDPDFHYVESGEEHLSNLVRLLSLSNGRGRSVAIVGGKGVGKKTLVRALVHAQQKNELPPQLMMRPVYRMNVNSLFNSSAPSYSEEKFNEVMRELKSIHDRRGVKPLLVIDDGTSFIKSISSGSHDNIVHTLDDADNASNYLDIVLIAREDALKDMHDSHPSFMADISTFKLDDPDRSTLMNILRHRAGIYSSSGIAICDDVLRNVMDVTTQYPRIFNYSQPKRAIRLLDEVAIGYQLKMHSRPEGYFDKVEHLEKLEKQIEHSGTGESRESLIGMRDALKIEVDNDLQSWRKTRALVQKMQEEIQSFEEMIFQKRHETNEMEREDRKIFDREAVDARKFLVECAEKGDTTVTKGLSADRFRGMDNAAILDFAKFDEGMLSNPKIKENLKEIGRYEGNISKIVQTVMDKSRELAFPVAVPAAYVEDFSRKLTKTDINPHMFEAMADSETLLNEVVLDQPDMNHEISSALRIAAAGGNDPDKPVGVFLILGPSGVGKTFVAETLSELVYGSKEKFLSPFNMENYMQSQNVSSLIGAPPGLVGYGERGLLIAAAQDKPYSVLLLDEIEKAHKDIKQTLLTALDKGRITGQDGEVGDLRNAIVVMTSNYGQDLFLDPSLSFDQAKAQVKERIYRDGSFSPEFLNRTTIVFANFLSQEAVVKIAQREAVKLEGRYKVKNPDLSLSFPQEAARQLVEDVYLKEQGARVVKTTVTRDLGNAVAEQIIAERKKGGKSVAGELVTDYRSGEGFNHHFVPAVEPVLSVTADASHHFQHAVLK